MILINSASPIERRIQFFRKWPGSENGKTFFFGTPGKFRNYMEFFSSLFYQIGHSEIYLRSAHVYCKTVSIKSYEVIDRTYPSPY